MNLTRLLADSVRRHPHRPAVAGPDGTLTYAELDDAAARLAGRLAVQGVGPGDRVLIWSAKSARAVVAMQAALRLGAAYVPLDARSPEDRVVGIAADCDAAVLLAGPEQLAALAGRDLGATAVLGLAAPLAGHPAVPPADPAPDDLAYILYTSGSTGKPKGVRLSHRNARAFVDWAVAELGLTEQDRLSNHASFTFDLSVLDLYGAFAAAASVHLVPTELASAPGPLAEFLRTERISVWYSVPSALTLMMRDGGLLDAPAPAGLRAVVFAGEPFPIEGVRTLAGWTGARLFNFYGPTETNVCTFHEVRPADLERDKPVPIGRACSGDRVWVETADGPSDAPGAEGELVAEGPTIMLGYHGRPSPGGTYRTGDIVRVLPDGVLDYLGRRDAMVKVRGYRVELGEVEAALATHPDVADVAAVVVGAGPESRLAAFVVPVPGGRAPGPLAVRRHAARLLPAYMLPDLVRPLDALPRTANGKVDRRLLADLADRPVDRTAGLSA